MTTPWYMPKRDQATWYYDGRKEPSTDGKMNLEDWIPYDNIRCEMIESAKSNNQSEAKIDGYTIDVNKMVQYNTDEPSKQRRVCRCEPEQSPPFTVETPQQNRYHQNCNEEDENRFIAPPGLIRPFGDWDISQFPLVEKWVKKNPHYKSKPQDTAEKIAYGIEKEGAKMNPSKTLESQYIANRIRQHEDRPLHEIMYYCVVLYTYQSFLYPLVNSTLRSLNEIEKKSNEEFRTKVDNLGPYCCMLRDFLHQDRKTIHKTVYRAVKLDPAQVDDYKKAIGQIKTWTAFSSTSKNPDIVKNFGNTLFVINFQNDAAPCYPGRDVSNFSIYEYEKEILLYPGVDFRIDTVEQVNEAPFQYKIHVSLM